MTYERSITSKEPDTFYSTLFDALPGNSLLLKADAPKHTIIAVTPQYLKDTGARKEYLLGKGVFEAFPSNNSDPDHTGEKDLHASYQHVMRHKEAHHLPTQRYDLLREDGSFVEKYWRASNTPILNAEGEVIYIVHTSVDITESIRAGQMEEKVKGLRSEVDELVKARHTIEKAKIEAQRQQRLYETITSNTPDLIYVFDLSYRFTYANKALLSMWGRSWAEAIGKGLRENGYEEWHAQMHEREIDHVVATKESVRGEVSFPHATLGRRIYDYILVPVLSERGEVEAVAGTTRDITEIKQAEQTIKEREESFRRLADESPMFVFIIEADPLAPVSYWNKTWLEYTGQTLNDAIGRAWDGIIHPDDVPVVMEHYVPAFQNRQPYHIPFVRVKRYDGEYCWHAFKGNPRYSPGGAFNGYVGVGLDVHEQKLAEEALKQSEARTRLAVETARLGTFEIDVAKQAIVYSTRTAEIFGFNPSEHLSYQTFINAVHPDDVQIRNKAHLGAIKTGELLYETRIILPDTSIRWIRLNGKYQVSEESPNILVGTVMDITEHKRAAEVLEEKIEESTQLKKRISEIKGQLEGMEERYVLGTLSQELYEKYAAKYKEEISGLEAELSKSSVQSSNLQKAVEKALKIAENVSQLWVSADYNGKQKLQYLLFPQGITYSKETGVVQTERVNSLFGCIAPGKRVLAKKKKGDSKKNRLKSSEVTASGFKLFSGAPENQYFVRRFGIGEKIVKLSRSTSFRFKLRAVSKIIVFQLQNKFMVRLRYSPLSKNA